ncbi:hypothetical protein CRG98_015037 [Punica granatum]|uniref:HMA domain-containing protein n=1 Tax=Punica granatum TaxID=22663 RepID=A0A2I0K7S7_PUNGR|nr:hypothetical protein CRG98_015037 [Punica granatum]
MGEVSRLAPTPLLPPSLPCPISRVKGDAIVADFSLSLVVFCFVSLCSLQKKDNGGEKKKSCCCGEDGKKDEKKNGPNAVVLKIDMHCEGCASKIIKCAKAFEVTVFGLFWSRWGWGGKGVEKAKVEWEASKLTVEGKVDPTKLRERLQEKTKKKVELVSPLPKKDKENKDDNTATTTSNKNNKNSGSGDSKGQEKKKADEKKPKEPPATTAVLKLGLHCQGCVQKIHKFVSKTSGSHFFLLLRHPVNCSLAGNGGVKWFRIWELKLRVDGSAGVTNVTIEQQKDLVTVTGTMDVKALAETLKGRMKRVVEIVPPKKEKEKVKDNEEKKDGNKGSGGGNEKEGCGNGNNQGNGSGGGKKKKGAGGGGGGEYGNAVGNKEEENGPAVGLGYPANTGYGYGCGYGYGYTYGESVHAPQYFSDENPNACSVM